MGLICVLLQLYIFVIFIRLIMSWFPPTPGTTYQQIYDAFVTVTEPVLGPVRAIMPPMRMGAMALDLSPIVVLLGLQLLSRLICG
ncbi:MAG TPA: YggT family protein [Acidimicrobiales bacterium]|jgi:YggT family protein|nr:YggT family protein [Acidimicrobiales bacterium]